MNSVNGGKPGTVAKCYQCVERRKKAAGEAPSGGEPSSEQHGDQSNVGGPWRGLKQTGEGGGGLQDRRGQTG